MSEIMKVLHKSIPELSELKIYLKKILFKMMVFYDLRSAYEAPIYQAFPPFQFASNA